MDNSPTVTLARTLLNGMMMAKSEIAKWQIQLETNPAYAFEWSGRAFNAAATLEVNARLLGYIGHDPVTGFPGENAAKTLEDSQVIFDRAQAHILSEALRLASGINNTSSSQTSNVLERAKAAHYANLASEGRRGW